MTKNETQQSMFPTYKGRPLVRSGDTLYYGDMRDEVVVKLDVKTKRKIGDLEIADDILIQMMYTDPDVILQNKNPIVKKSEKKGLYLALDIADVWLTRALSDA